MKKREMIYFIILTLFLVGSHSAFADTRFATIDGYCYLEGAESHEGTKILFTAVTPSAITDSTYTNTDGSFLMGLSEGIYTVQYSHEGWLPNTIPGEIDFFVDTTLGTVTLSAPGIEVTGSQSGVWAAGYTYNVMDDISVSDGDTLIIEPGVTVKFMDYYSFTIYGKLVAAGTEADSIRFTSGQPYCNPGDWDRIKFEGISSSNSVISYTKIEYASSGIDCYNSSPTISNNEIIINSTGIDCCSNSNPIICNNTISYNNSEGIYCSSSSPTISNNTISNNSYGIKCNSSSSPTISSNTISYNNSGGIYCNSSSPTISNNTIKFNRSEWEGSGIYCDYNSSPIISNNTISNNNKGICCYYSSSPIISNNTIEFNLSFYEFEGSGIYCYSSSSPIISNNTISNNSDGIHCRSSSSPTILNNILYNNNRGIGANSSPSALEHNLFWLNDNAGTGNVHASFGEIVTVNANGDSCDTYFNLFMDPLFVDPDSLDFHLTENSPCIDAGDPDQIYYDPDGTVADIGAFYFDQGSEAPVINDFTGEPVQGSAPLVVQFTQSVTGPVTEYNWSFGDESTSMFANPVHVYTSPGTYSVTLIVTGPGGTESMTMADYISVLELQIPPSANFSGLPLLGTAPLEVNFSNMSTGEMESYLWEFGDGNTSTEINPAYEYQNPGLYTVTLTAYGVYGTDTKIKENYVEVIEPEEVIAAFTVSGNNGCAPYPVTFINQSVGTIDSLLWDFGDGEISIEENPFHIYEGAGVFEVILTIYGQINTAIANETITVELAEPVILAIMDIPEDQGGLVNVNFSRSFYDTDTLRTTEGYNIEIETDSGWTGVSSIYGYGAESYNVIVITPYDSTAANNGLINFRVIAAMEEGNWVSEIEQGYSVDNMAPAIPAELRIEDGYLLWSEPIDADFAYFSVFRDEVLLNNCIEPEISLVGIMGELCVAAYDCHGNASQMSENITGGYPYGDPDNNLAVEAMDASLVLQYFCLLVPEGTILPWENWRTTVADVDGNGVVEAYDASLILMFSVGFIDEFPVINLRRR